MGNLSSRVGVSDTAGSSKTYTAKSAYVTYTGIYTSHAGSGDRLEMTVLMIHIILRACKWLIVLTLVPKIHPSGLLFSAALFSSLASVTGR